MDRGIILKRKTCPKQEAGFLSLLTFAYLLKFVHKGRKREIEENDLFKNMDSFQSKSLGDKMEFHWNKEKIKNRKPSIINAIVACYGKTLLFLGSAQICVKVAQINLMPWALANFVSYFEKDQTDVTREMAFVYAGTLISVSFLNGLWEQHFNLWKIELGLKIQASIASLLYRKSLALTQAKLLEISTGKIVTTIVKDVSSLNNMILYGVDFILEFFQVVLVGYMLYSRVGIGSVGGLSLMGFSLILQICSTRLTYMKRSKCNASSDQRLQQTQEVLSSVRLIKMYRWEAFFRERLLKVRKLELLNLKMVFIWKSVSIILGTISGRLAQASVFLLYMYLGNILRADTVYYIQQLFQKVSKAMIFIPLGLQFVAESIVSLGRINAIMNAEENNTVYKSTIQMLDPEVNFTGADVSIGKQIMLKNLNLKLKAGLHLLVGPSGCGKSTLLKVILEEFNTSKGRMNVHGTISYASQNPWLFPSSLKQNILFGQPYDDLKYKNIVRICGLTYDFNLFVNGDETILTDCGANLSKGQQSRINLARALYRESDIYLLDDCLASLDIKIKNQIFNDAIKNYLKRKLCILITHNTQFVNQADNIIIMSENTIKYSGKPSEIPPEIFEKMEEAHNDDVDETMAEAKSNEKNESNEESNELSTLLGKAEKSDKNIYGEKKKTGRVDLSCYKSYFKFGGGFIMLFTLVGLHLICELTNGVGEKFMSAWVNQQKASFPNTSINLNSSLDVTTEAEEWITTESLVTLKPLFADEYSTTTPIELTGNLTKFSESPKIGLFHLYIIAIIVSTAFIIVRCFLTYHYTIKVSKNIHKSMVTNIVQACMVFFDTHLIGNILTRFSRDLYIMDELIPFVWLEGFRIFFLLPVCLLLIASVSYALAAASIVLTVVFYYLCDYVLSTTRSAQRLSNSTLSPVIGHLNSSLEGLITIRAYGNQRILRDEFDKHQDVYISANHLREMAARVIGFYSHTIASIFTSYIIMSFLFRNNGVLAGDVGLVISQSTMLVLVLEMCLVMWMIMENSMTSVERAVEYTKLPQEHQPGRDLDQWPEAGGIKFQKVSLAYRPNGELVLKDLNLTIHPQEKIGIVGRTGAGKSSIIVALFKMYNFTGDIFIDNVNIKTLSLECLRTHLSIIPQDPVMFTGTVRTNIDPYNTMKDEQIWKSLEIVNLKLTFKSLDEDIMKKNLSIGQKQLICLARAITRKSKIVILDEATASMDEEMDSFIQKKIREVFRFCTTIIVAHRLHTVRHCDRIIVMDNGRVIEFDTPKNLLSNTNGLFYKMVNQKKNKAIDMGKDRDV